MTSPKAISKSFTHYAVKHPELSFRVIRYTQIPGSYRRSSDARKGTEVAFTSKKWFFPMLLRSNELMVFTASYLLTGRFNPELELRRRPSETVTAELVEAQEARKNEDPEIEKRLHAIVQLQRDAEFGRKSDWDRYGEAIDELRGESFSRGLETPSAKEFAINMKNRSRVELDDSGALWLNYEDEDGSRRLGISASNVNASESDGELAYTLLLARASAELSNSAKNREMLPEFETEWQLLQGARNNLNWKILARQLRQSAPDNAGLPSFTSGSRP
jgi:hypothetical protein